jgi:hypothetical protein
MPTTDHNSASQILGYLREKMPGYPFEPDADKDFVEELLGDFPHVCVLDEIKACRWYYGNRPINHVRVAIRRWLVRAPGNRPSARRSS